MILMVFMLCLFDLSSSSQQSPLEIDQKQLDDIHISGHFFNTLPQDYLQSQSQNLQLHPLIIYPQINIQPSISSDFYRILQKALRISTYYFSQVISVETIKPQTQTLYPLGWNCNNFAVPQVYFTKGFDPQKIDLVLFVQQSATVSRYGICVIQRRPIYALFSILPSSLSEDSTFDFHKSIYKMNHGMFHILGFNPRLFNYQTVLNSNFLFGGYENPILWNNFKVLINGGAGNTAFYENPYSNKFITQKNAIKLSPFFEEQYMVILPGVRKWFQSVFDCNSQKLKIYNSGLNDEVGPLLFSKFKSIYDCFACSLNHWDFYLGNDIMGIGYFDGNRLQNKIFQLNLIMLQDTGYYQQVDIMQADALDLSLKNKGCNQLSAIANKNYCYNASYSCDQLGLHKQSRLQKFKLGAFGGPSQYCQYTSQSCQQYSQKKKCFQSWTNSFPNYCFTTQCKGSGSDLHLVVIVGNLQVQGCYQGQTEIQIHRITRKIKCPKYLKSFCSVQFCDDYCNYQGFCSNGVCKIPPITFNSHLIQNNPIYAICTDNNGNNLKVLCQLGCSKCRCTINLSTGAIKTVCQDTFPGYSKLYEDQIQTIRFCRWGCQSCINHHQFCYGCFKNYYMQQNSHSCLPCDQTCSACTVGDNLAIIQCTNCRQGKYIDFQGRCISCQVQNCLKCQKQTLKCLFCRDGYSLTKNRQKCIQCLSGCSKCDQNNIKICLGCKGGYFQDPISKQCLACSYGCQICDNQNNCTVCYQDWLKNSQNKCQIKCKHPCITCKANDLRKCLSCSFGYKLNQFNETCQGNASCNTNKSCSQCPAGYVLNSIQKQCIKCKDSNCLQCKLGKTNICQLCISGYYSDKNKLCSKCDQSCSQCVWTDVCTSCNDGYGHPRNIDNTIIKQKCQLCIGNCKLCPSDRGQCILCKDNYKKLGWKCVPQKNLQYNITIGYKRTLTYFLQNNVYQEFQISLRKAFNIPDVYQNTFVDFSEGSVKIIGQLGYSFTISQQTQCQMYVNFVKNLQAGSNVQGFQILAVSLIASNKVCKQYPLQNQIIITQYVIGLDPGILLIIVAVLMLISAIIIFIVGWRSRKQLYKIILKYEQLRSRQQYQSTSLQAKQKEKEAF